MIYCFKELVDIPKLQDLTDELYLATSIPSAIITLDGEVLTGSGWQRICTDFHRKHPEILKDCIESDIRLHKGLSEGEPYVIYKCPRGLVDALSPVVIDGEHVANVFAGQVFMEQPDETTEQFFRKQARKYGLSEEDYISAYHKIPVFKEDVFRHALSFLSKFALLVASIGLARKNELDAKDVIQNERNKLNSIIGAMTSALTIRDRNYNITFQSPQVTKYFGDIVGQKCYKVFEQENDVCDGCPAELSFDDGESHTAVREIKMPDGNIAYWENVTSPIVDHDGSITACIEIATDITERRKSEEELRKSEEKLRKSEEKFRTIAENTSDNIWIMNLDNEITFSTPAIKKITGFSPEEMCAMPLEKILTEKSCNEARSLLNYVLENEKLSPGKNSDIHTLQFEQFHKKGHIVYTEATMRLIMDNNGNMHVLGITRDITERIAAQDLQKYNEQRYRTTIDSLNEAIQVVDKNLNIVLLNNVYVDWLKSLGINENIIGLEISKALPFLSKNVIDEYKKVLATGCDIVTQEVNTFGGEELHTETRKIPFIENGKINGIIVVIRNITEQKQLEEERAKASKIESIGILAGGIAHDFNNILAAILGNVTLAKMHYDIESDAYELLREAENASMRATKLTQQLLTFSKGGTPLKEIADIKELIRDTVKFSLRGSNVVSRITIAKDLWVAHVDKGQLGQVFGNLAINAQQAMPEGGTVAVSANNASITLESKLNLEPGNYIEITFKDKGEGIMPENISRIFDPYFTSKKKGSGLGLATTYSIIHRHNGHISVESEIGKGTTFKIYIPGLKDQSIPGKITKEESVVKNGNILVMDDEASVRKVIGIMLKTLGNSVTTASDGAEAIKYYTQALESENPFDIVIMDLTVPGGMGGIETIKELLKINPEVRVIVSSGYSHENAISNYSDYGFKACIIKPYIMDDLSEVLNDVMSK
jgi:two-component system, cell cycle sensor histidine kinase and response regulator CckA